MGINEHLLHGLDEFARKVHILLAWCINVQYMFFKLPLYITGYAYIHTIPDTFFLSE